MRAVHCAANGSDALTAMLTGRHDIVFVDCKMPVMDGYRASAEARVRGVRNRWGSQLASVARTANAMAGDRQKCFAAGTDDHLSKPFRLEEMESSLQRSTARPVVEVP